MKKLVPLATDSEISTNIHNHDRTIYPILQHNTTANPRSYTKEGCKINRHPLINTTANPNPTDLHLAAIAKLDHAYKPGFKYGTAKTLKRIIKNPSTIPPDINFITTRTQKRRTRSTAKSQLIVHPDGVRLGDFHSSIALPKKNKLIGGALAELDSPYYFIEQEPMQWGLGVEHEMQLFHLGQQTKTNSQIKMQYTNANIVFDSQESTCFITADNDSAGACRKSRPRDSPYYSPPAKLRKHIFKKSDRLTPEELKFLLSIDWEATGRYIKGCKPDPYVVNRIPVLMPELVTGQYQNRTLQSIANETVFLEEMFIKCQMKNPFTREKVNIYGPLITHKCGALANIQVPIRPTYSAEYYELVDEHWKDYLGSYHITLTLPHKPSIDPKDFIALHEAGANQIQWLEPLLVPAFFTGDPDPQTRLNGSFRVGAVGWGNFAGSDVRKFGSHGITRGANIKTHWRTGLDLAETAALDGCVKTAPPPYKKSVSSLMADFRTFGFENDDAKCKSLYNPNDCPKADGAPMLPPYGMEIRIFDHFHSEYLLDLLKLIVLICSNAQRHPATKHVYKNPLWIGAMQTSMKQGSTALLTKSFVRLLLGQLGLPKPNSNIQMSLKAQDVLNYIITELHAANYKSQIVQLLDESPDILPRMPAINRECWELSFTTAGYMNVLIDWLKNNIAKRNYTRGTFEDLLFNKMSPFSKCRWGHQFNSICYALETNGYVKLTLSKTGDITHIKLL
jgi:hypothetical protein